MVRDLEDDASGRRSSVRQEARSTSRADVTGQQDRDVAVAQLEHDRVVVADAPAFPVGRRRMQHPQLDAADLERSPRLHRAPRGARARSASRAEPSMGTWFGTGTPPTLRGREIAQQRSSAAEVIGIAVRDGEIVERPAPRARSAGPSTRSPISNVAADRRRRRRRAAPAVGNVDQHRFALPDVEHRQQ